VSVRLAQDRRFKFAFIACALLFALSIDVQAQTKPYRVGVLVPGEPWYEVVDGLRTGLKELGLQEGKGFVLAIHDWKGDEKAAEAAAKKLEKEKFDLLYTTSTNSTVAAKRATVAIPIVFSAGTDPVVVGFVDSYAKPGGRLTGIHNPSTDLTAKRFELFKEMVPKLRRVVTFYNPRLASAIESSKLARQAAQPLGIELIERHAVSVEEFQARVRALRTGEVDGYLAVSDAIASSQAQLVIDTARSKRFPTMFDFISHAIRGGLASYGVSFHEMGRRSAKYVQRILTGVKPNDLPVEQINKIEFVINLKTAKQIGLTIPPNVLARADRVIK
jgi:ABC-type uncharacterized transport system substrate-binding protein